jgi:hypothetical protein
MQIRPHRRSGRRRPHDAGPGPEPISDMRLMRHAVLPPDHPRPAVGLVVGGVW